jgi:hypothetical protein
MPKVKVIKGFKQGDEIPIDAVWKYSKEVQDGQDIKIGGNPDDNPGRYQEIRSFITYHFYEIEIEKKPGNEQF